MLLVISVHYTSYLTYIRIKRHEILKKHKPGTLGYENYLRLLSWQRLVGSIVVMLGLTGYLLISLRAVLDSHEQSQQYILVFAPIASVLTLAASFAVAHMLLGKKASN